MDCPRCTTTIADGDRFCPKCGTSIPDSTIQQDPLVGMVVDERYRVTGLLGAGGMGRVYAAEHVKLGTRFAVKVLHDRFAGDPNREARFLREARLAAQLNHRNCVSVSDYGTVLGSPYIIMEYLEGESLASLLKRGRLETGHIVVILVQVALALEAAHSAGIVHRDLKPDNIMLVRDGSGTCVKVLDFGIAKLMDPEAEGTKLTADGSTCGTPEYMSPEQLSGGTVDHRTDFYALGCVLYEMLTGEAPFKAGNAMGVMLKHLNEVPKRPSDCCPDRSIPRPLEAVCLECLAKDPAERPATAEEFRRRLLSVRGSPDGEVPFAVEGAVGFAETEAVMPILSTPVLVSPGEVVGTVTQTPPFNGEVRSSGRRLPARRVWQIAAAVAAVSLSLVVFLVFSLKGSHDAPANPPNEEPAAQSAPSPALDAPAPDATHPGTSGVVESAPREPIVSAGDEPEPRKPPRKNGKKGTNGSLKQGQKLIDDGRCHEAINYFEGLLSSGRKDPEIHYGLGLCYTRRSQAASAIRHLETYLESNPRSKKKRARAEGMLKMLK